MKVIFVSNFLNHHQIDLCRFLERACEDFHFIETESMPESIRKFGYSDYSNEKYIVKTYQSKQEEQKAKNLIMDADAVIYGACPTEYVKMRMIENKLSFIFSERLWKKGTYRRFIPTIRRKVFNRVIQYKDQNLYVLCASGYLPYDLKLLGFSTDKCFKWGYFPPKTECSLNYLITKKQNILRIIWCGRFIPLKRATDSLKAIKCLKRDGYEFEFVLIGQGEQESLYRKYIQKNNLENCVTFLGNLPQEAVRQEMQKSDILLFNSNFKEGWGAVVNEAMNSACVPVVSHATGAASMMIKNGENGFIYQMGRYTDLYNTVKYIIDSNLLVKVRKEAFNTINEEWNGYVAGERLLRLIECLSEGEDTPYSKGPCSKVKVIKNSWFKEKIWKNPNRK